MKSEPVAAANIVEVQTSAADDDDDDVGGACGGGEASSPSSSSAAASGGQGGGSVQTISINGQQYQIVSPSVEAMHTINVGASSSQGLGVGSTSGVSGLMGGAEDATRKREIRLLKNREAARECRNKKKEYIKCLENRVAVLENQNKALIEELKSLKELYTGHKN